jgi:hypothetical protein
MKKALQKKKTFKTKKMISIEKKRLHIKEMISRKKKTKRSENNQKARKNFEIQASISQKIFSFFDYRAEIFDSSANIDYFEEFDSFNEENRSSKLYVFLRKLCV